MPPAPASRAAPFAAAALLLAACSGETGNGRLSLSVTDAPVDDLDAVVVEFSGVELGGSDGGGIVEIPIDPPLSVDLLALAGGGQEPILRGATVPAGTYHWLRLEVRAQEDGIYGSFVRQTGGAEYELEIPSSTQSGLKLIGPIIVNPGEHPRFTVDFDLRKSISAPRSAPGSYLMKPALRLIADDEAGEIAGSVSPSIVGSACSPAVYVFEGTGTTPDDLDGIDPDAVTTAVPTMKSDGSAYEYRVAFLPPGAYTVVFTCGAGDDEPDSNDTLIFGPAKDAIVESQRVTRVDFGE